VRTVGLIDDCTLAGKGLVCLADSATRPARVTSFDGTTGSETVLFDPNPEFVRIRFGTVERLEWKNVFGLEVRGNLVLPPNYSGGERLPLVVTTYTSHGFLQGATGDEFPIHAFAARGIAVLSFNRPVPASTVTGQAKDYDGSRKADLQGWTERRSINSAVLAGVQRTIDLGIADPQRIGITGLSDGASIVAFALINSGRFAAAAMSTCCLEPWSIVATSKPMSAAGIGPGRPYRPALCPIWPQGQGASAIQLLDTGETCA
jgi:dipeptidyl aminopeptidase/acylaminoacyl peptidase